MSAKKIMIADDEEDMRDVTRMILEAEGYTVVTAYDGLDALSMAEAEMPDLLLLDLMMPVMSGLDVARKMKESATLSAIPIIMLSAAGQADSVQAALAAGAQDFLVKPFEPTLLMRRVAETLAG